MAIEHDDFVPILRKPMRDQRAGHRDTSQSKSPRSLRLRRPGHYEPATWLT
jgi:hypothetical protein